MLLWYFVMTLVLMKYINDVGVNEIDNEVLMMDIDLIKLMQLMDVLI